MILTCPFCGLVLPERLVDGLASCLKCSSVFENSTFNRLLSAGWVVRNNNCNSVEQLISDTKISECEAILVNAFVYENLYSHEEFFKTLKTLGFRCKL